MGRPVILALLPDCEIHDWLTPKIGNQIVINDVITERVDVGRLWMDCIQLT